MNTIMKLIALTTLIAAPAFAAAGPVNGKIHNQRIRIAQGVESGQLTRPETAALLREQRQIRSMARHFHADGVLTPGEFSRLRHRQALADRHIFVQKHDRQKRL